MGPGCAGNCSFHGSCAAGVCLCDAGWGSADCSSRLNGPGCLAGCSARGSCVNATCVCDYGWSGAACDAPTWDAPKSVDCDSNCSSGAGVLSNGTCICAVSALCSGNCSGRGVCVNGMCLCDEGFGGLACELTSPDIMRAACINNCSAHGACSNGTCVCDMGWASIDCSAALETGEEGGMCASNCSGQGSCMNGTCFCDLGFAGTDCSLAGGDEICHLNCSGHGNCKNSTCVCDAAYTGSWCQTLSDFVSGNSSSDSEVCPENCNGHGSCQGGVCVCDSLYGGSTCISLAIFVVSFCPEDCSGHGTCLNGTCSCDLMWGGLDCSSQGGCLGSNSELNVTCSGHGLCYNNTCVCDSFWTGLDCADTGCVGGCFDRGICLNGTCACQPGWSGLSCESLSCPNDCSGHGSCSSELWQRPQCACDEGWQGSDCSVQMCPSISEGLACSGNGACTQNGTCICYQSWAGADCSQLIDCSSRGKRICGFCACAAGFSGSDCEVDICADSRVYDPMYPGNYSKSSVCSNRGVCTTDKGCVCQAGWAGQNCSQLAHCPQNCSGHGICFGGRDNAGQCSCTSYNLPNTPFSSILYTGAACSVEHCPGYIEGNPGQECSGRGSCSVQHNTYTCICFRNPATNQPYTGEACSRPPQYFLQSIVPAVGPLEGGTVVSVMGPGLELLLSEQNNDVFCFFGQYLSSQALFGNARDSLMCYTPPSAIAGLMNFSLMGRNHKVLRDPSSGAQSISNTLHFEYFAQTQVLRVSPTFLPLRPIGPRRWIGPWDAFGPNQDGSNVITVTGSYIPPNGIYLCKFGDCVSENADRIDAATMTCVMPTMAAASDLQIYISSNAQQFSNSGGESSLFKTYEVTALSPVCGSILGTAMVTVFGKNLVDNSDPSRNVANQYCRFGRTSSTGQVMTAAPDKKVLAFYSQAVPSSEFDDALECVVPNWPVEEDDFALSLDATCGVADCSSGELDGYYTGQWDAYDTLADDVSYNLTTEGIPQGVKFSTFYQPEIVVRADLSIKVITPSIGPSSGGTWVTVTGRGFDFPRYGPNTPNDVYAAWTPPQVSFPNGGARCGVLFSPEYHVSLFDYSSSPAACQFGTDISTDVIWVSEGVVICVSPRMLDPVDSPTDVTLEIALDGQSFTSNGFLFQYVPPSTVTEVIPSSGVVSGGTWITVEGTNFVESGILSNQGSVSELSCVFILPPPGSKRILTSAILVSCVEESLDSCTAVTCPTPEIAQESLVSVYVSVSGQTDDSQLSIASSGSSIQFTMFFNPEIALLLPAAITTDFGDYTARTISVQLSPFPNILTFTELSNPQNSILLCKFGNMNPVPATLQPFKEGDKPNMRCSAPKVTDQQEVRVAVSLNGGSDWSTHNLNFTFVKISGLLSPSSGPVSGGTICNLTANNNLFYTAIFGSPSVPAPQKITGIPAGDIVQFTTPSAASIGRFGTVVVNLQINIKRESSSSELWFDVGLKFIYYDTTDLIPSVLPCSNALDYNMILPNCIELFLPEDGRNNPVSFFVYNGLLSAQISNELDLFLTASSSIRCFFSNGRSVMEFCASFVWYETFGVITCASPSLVQSNAVDAYNISLSLNGQNSIEKTFHVQYVSNPKIWSVLPTAGQMSGGLLLTIVSSSFLDSKGRIPPLLSCAFFNLQSGEFHFVSVQNENCNKTGPCTVYCMTPQMNTLLGQPCPSIQIFISVNQRDPCFSSMCGQNCVDCNCLEGNGVFSRFNTYTNSWCPSCQANTNCSDMTCRTGGTTFQYYQDPVFYGMSPLSVSNKPTSSIVVSLFGSFPICYTLRNIVVNAKYIDGTKSTAVLISVPRQSVSASSMAFQLPLPCPVSSSATCQKNISLNFTQINDVMSVQFSTSFNGGGQFAISQTSLVLEVYGPNYPSFCPKDGCGHGTCLNLQGSNSKPATGTCLCGFWLGTQSNQVPTCGLVNSPASNEFCSCTTLSCPGVNCSAPNPMQTIFGSVPSLWFCTLQTTVNPSEMAYTYGPEWWTGSYHPNEIGCSSSPLIMMFSPSVGVNLGGTRVQLTLNTLDGFSNESKIGILRNSACYFGSVLSSNISISQGSTPGTFILNCKSPRVSQLSVNVTIMCTLINQKGVPSPLSFPFAGALGSSTFLYRPKPSLHTVTLEICDPAKSNCSYFGGANLSAPVCVGYCNRVSGERNILSGMAIFLQGLNFEDVSGLVCCFSNSGPCSSLSSPGLVSSAEYISPTQIRCPIFIDPSDSGYYQVAVSLNGQEYSEFAGSYIYFYQPPLGALGRATDQSNTEDVYEYGVENNSSSLFNLGPVQGGSPLIIYFAEQCTSSSCSTSSMTIPTFQSKSKLKFVPCPNTTTLDSCSCYDPEGQQQFWSQTSLRDPKGVSKRIMNSTNLVFTLQASSPNVESAGPGRYLMCFAVNGIHFLPITTITSPRWNNYLPSSNPAGNERFDFSFYLPQIISRVVPASGPYVKNDEEGSYPVYVLGENFLTNIRPIFVYFCTDVSNSDLGGCSFASTYAVNATKIHVENSSAFSIIITSDMQMSNVNITISYNLYDFSPVRKGMTQFRFYDTPTINNIFPSWGLYDYETIITIVGVRFDNLPLQSVCIFAKCYDSTCSSYIEPIVLRATTFISSTAVSCIAPPKPPEVPGVTDRVMNMFVTYNPRYASGTEIDDLKMQTKPIGGSTFQFSDSLSNVMQSDTLNLPLGGGRMDISVYNQYWCSKSASDCTNCMNFTQIPSLAISLIPSSLNVKKSNGVIRSVIIDSSLKIIPAAQAPFPALGQTCLVRLSARFPKVAFPLEADLQISFDDGQHYTGTAKSILIYRQVDPVSVFPLRVSRSFPIRPTLNIFFSTLLLSTTGPAITQSQATSAFSSQACGLPLGYCYAGPYCQFQFLNMSNLTKATFNYDEKSPSLSCIVPQYGANGSAQISVSFDGINFFSSSSSFVYLYNEPFVNEVFPTTGFWTAKTQLLLSGEGFLDPGSTYHQTWCIFDFQEILPASDQWNVPRMWSKAYPMCPSSTCSSAYLMSCSAPSIAPSKRPSIPSNPRARLGLIVDGYCTSETAAGDCSVLMNANGRGELQSNAFFFYSDLPVISAVVPQAGVPNENLFVTITGSGFIDEYNWGPSIQDVNLLVPFEREQTQKLCSSNPGSCSLSAYKFPCPGLTCRFGRICSCPQGQCVDLVSNISAIFSELTPNQVICKVPPLFVAGLNSSVFNLSVSLNGQPGEYSSPLSFVLVNLFLSYVSPSFGSAAGGGIVSVYGDNFRNISCGGINGWACLHCRFELTGPLSTQQQFIQVPAVFFDSSLLTCVVPPATNFGIQWEAGNVGMLPAICSNNCILKVSVTVNQNTYTKYTSASNYVYKDEIIFTNIGANSSEYTGNMSLLVYASNLDITSQVQCRFGFIVVEAVVTTESVGNGYVSCQVPSWSGPGVVDFGLSINAKDFCNLLATGSNTNCVRSYIRQVGSNGVAFPQSAWPSSRLCQCIPTYTITQAQKPKIQKFVYHNPMMLTNIVPPSGIEEGGTEIYIVGQGFKAYGQALFVYFGVPPVTSASESGMDFRVGVPATIVNSTAIKCLTPTRPGDTVSDSQIPPGTYYVFILDVAVPVQVSSNGKQFTTVQDGSACVENTANAISRDNKKAQCTLPFVMFSWFSLPSITSIVGPIPAENIYPKLGAAAPSLYNSLSQMTQNIAQGLVGGGTAVTLQGDNFISMARAEVINGQGTSVECSGAEVNGVVPPGKSCTTTCVFPFATSITAPGVKANAPYPYYYGCVNLPFTITEPLQNNYWCDVEDQPPAIFNGKYGFCRNDISVWNDYNQGGKVITSLECRFGEIHVPATVVPLPTSSTQNPVLGRQIICISPPSPFGILVPLSVTLNRVDYSQIQPFTYFQYLKPAPLAIGIKVNPILSQFIVEFDVETNMAGQAQGYITFCQNMKIFADGIDPLSSENLVGEVSEGGKFPTPPLCQWIDRSSLSLQLGVDYTITNNSLIPFKTIPCDVGSIGGDCWKWNYFETLRSQDSFTTDILTMETANVGCAYPRNPSLPGPQECSSGVIQRTAPGWCGACLPTASGVAELSLPFNRSRTSLFFYVPMSAVIAPVPYISGPSSVDNCQSRCDMGSSPSLPGQGKICTFDSDCPGGKCRTALVNLDASRSFGNLGKSFQKIVWSLDPNPLYNQDLNPLISDYNFESGMGQSLPYLTPTFFPGSTGTGSNKYCFILTLSNWLGGVGSSKNCFLVQRSIGIPVPQITIIEGETLTTFTRFNDLVLNTNISTSACAAGKSFPTSFQWTISPALPLSQLLTEMFNTPKLLIRAYSIPFIFNQVYTFKLNATVTDPSFGSSTSSIQIALKCIPGSPYVAINGGVMQTYSPTFGPLILDASRSFDVDVDVAHRSLSDLLFCWSCKVSFHNCPWITDMNLTLDQLNTSIVTIPSTNIVINSSYSIVLSVFKRTGISCKSSLAVAASLPSTELTISVYSTLIAPKVSIVPPLVTYISFSSPLRISGSVQFESIERSCECSYSWALDPPITSPTLNMNAASGTFCGTVELLITAGAFSPVIPNTYHIQLSATCNSSFFGAAAIDIPSVTPPSSGSCSVTPSTGVAFQTLFAISCQNWVDEFENLPIQYRFSIVSSATGDRIVLAPWSESSVLSTVLPSGDSSNNYVLNIIADVKNIFGVLSQAVALSVNCNPRTLSNTQFQSTLSQMSATLLSYQNNNFDADATMGFLGIFALNLNDLASAAGVTISKGQLVQIQTLRDQLVNIVAGTYSPGHQRRLLDTTICASSVYDATVALFVSRLQISTSTPAPDSPSAVACSIAKQSISCYLQSGNDLGSTDDDAVSAAQDMFQTLGNCLNMTNMTELYGMLRTLSILIMKNRNSADKLFGLNYKGLALLTKRYVASDLSIKMLQVNTQINITFPSNIGLTLPSTAAFDALVVAASAGISQNLYKAPRAQQVFGPIAEISVHTAFQQETDLSNLQLVDQVANVSTIQIHGLLAPIVVDFSLETKAPFSYNPISEVFNASACNFYNTSAGSWVPFGPNFAAACEPQCPWITSPNKDLSQLSCPTSHLTAFSAVQTAVGCDFVPSLTPKQTDICCLCDGVGTSCCDWRRINSANNIPTDVPCPTTDDGQGLDKCLVCQKHLSLAVTHQFTGLQFKNVSGVCDFRGIPCVDGLIPNACGVCDLPSNELQRTANTGLCDCDPNDPKLPNEPGGGEVIDRCGICNGGNKSMDDCGTNPSIPAYDPLGLFQCCHSGGRGKAQVPRWDMACTGCDNVTRPDLPFISTRRPYPGGVQVDKCGVCGGDDTTCYGCDGLPASAKKLDFCRVCGGTNNSCIGCDGIRNPTPTVLDSCGVCGGSDFGACDVSYLYEFTEILALNLPMQNFDLSRQHLLQVTNVFLIQHIYIMF